MTLYSDAIAAYQAAQGNREGEARTVLAATLTGADTTTLDVTDVEVTPDHTRYVFTDGYLFLAVVLADPANTVTLVTGQVGDWTEHPPALTSLADLGKVLPGVVPPPNTPTGPDPWAPDTPYATGDQVTYNGTTYQCVQGHTSQVGWEPPNVPALWSVVA